MQCARFEVKCFSDLVSESRSLRSRSVSSPAKSEDSHWHTGSASGGDYQRTSTITAGKHTHPRAARLLTLLLLYPRSICNMSAGQAANNLRNIDDSRKQGMRSSSAYAYMIYS